MTDSRYHPCPHDRTYDTCGDCIEAATNASTDTIAPGGEESDLDSKMEDLVEAASVPNLASLFRAGKQAGLIKPGKEYGNAS